MRTLAAHTVGSEQGSMGTGFPLPKSDTNIIDHCPPMSLYIFRYIPFAPFGTYMSTILMNARVGCAGGF